jgi:hypothetical protein
MVAVRMLATVGLVVWLGFVRAAGAAAGAVLPDDLAGLQEQLHCFDAFTVSGSPLIRVLSVSGLSSEK